MTCIRTKFSHQLPTIGGVSIVGKVIVSEEFAIIGAPEKLIPRHQMMPLV